jgi:hypothetical protein
MAMRQRDVSPSGEGASKHLFWMELSKASLHIVRNMTQKTMRVTIEDTETENFLSKAKFTSVGGCASTWAQQGHRVDHKPAFNL